MKVEWKDIPSFEGLYQVSSDGIVRSVDRFVPNDAQRDFVKNNNGTTI